MDELPSQAKSVLALAKDGHDPDEAARARLRSRLALALGAPPAAAAGLGAAPASAPGVAGKTASGWGTWIGAKGWIAIALIGVSTLGATLMFASVGSRPAPPRPAQEGRAQEQPGPRPVLVEAVPAAPQEPPADALPERPAALKLKPEPRAGGAPRAAAGEAGDAFSLAQETALLARAADLLNAGNAAAAKQLIEQHRRRFAHPMLREERDGLRVLARCVEQPERAQREARAFVARAPASVLVPRIEKACTLSGGPHE